MAGGSIGDNFGGSVAISGGTVVVGATDMGRASGGAYVFTSAAGWRQVTDLLSSDTSANYGFGAAVAVSGSTAVVSNGEEAYVFQG